MQYSHCCGRARLRAEYSQRRRAQLCVTQQRVSPKARVAIVTTLRAVPRAMLWSFVGWHLHLGFARIYLYFDDPRDTGIDDAKRVLAAAIRKGHPPDCVRIVPCDGVTRGEWGALKTYLRWEHMAQQISQHVEVRQMLNAEHALRHAHADADIEWLLHIDSDELFMIDDLDAAAHFGRLSAHGCVNFRYPIHEGCPEQPESDNVFRTVTLFKRHVACVEETLNGSAPAAAAGGRRPEPADLAAAAGAFAFWQHAGRHYFLGSKQGKSATRVLPGSLPISVHAFHPPNATDLARCWAGFEDDQDELGASLRVVRPSGGPCILHYISCDARFWHHKYELLGQFGHKPGGERAGGLLAADSFHVQSRRVVAQRDAALARQWYTEQVCLLDAEEVQRQLASGVCARVTHVREALEAGALVSSPSRLNVERRHT